MKRSLCYIVVRNSVAILALIFSALLHLEAPTGYWSLWLLFSDNLALGLLCLLCMLFWLGPRSKFFNGCLVGAWILLLSGAHTRAYQEYETEKDVPNSTTMTRNNSGRIMSETPRVELSRLRVLSYNLKYNNQNPLWSVALIEEVDAELVLLQEVNESWKFRLQGLLQYPHRAFWVKPIGEGLAILSKYPLSAIERVSHLGPAAQCADVSVEDTIFGVCNVHLVSPALALFSRHLPEDLATRWARNTLNRQQQWEQIEDLLGRRERVAWLVAGDFNTTPRSPLYKRFNRYLTDIFENSSPWVGTYPHICLYCPHPKARIDYIFVLGAIKPLSKRILWGGGSDHLALTAEFRGD